MQRAIIQFGLVRSVSSAEWLGGGGGGFGKEVEHDGGFVFASDDGRLSGRSSR